MTDQTAAGRGFWSSRLAFILAATGSAVGLGNIWKFPYIAGENGGGAFVLVYLVCIGLVGLPLLTAEILLGRRGASSPTDSLRRIAVAEGHSPLWRWAGSLGSIAAFMILCFYNVIGGWSLAYLWEAMNGVFTNTTPAHVQDLFKALLADPWQLIFWHTLFSLMVIIVVARGVSRGIEKAVSVLMPAMFILLLVLVAYAFTTEGFTRSLEFMFAPHFGDLTTGSVLEALGHAFFTLSLGMSVMVAYGSHLHEHISIPRTALIIAILDTAVALLAGIAIFAIVFSNGMEPDKGPGLIFQTIPLAFNALPAGWLLSTIFFFLLLFAAWSSAISVLEAPVEGLETKLGQPRPRVTWWTGGLAWLIGILCALSFNVLDQILLGGKILFDAMDFLTTNILLPLTGLLIAIFAGWILSNRSSIEELDEGIQQRVWRWLIRYLTPGLVLLVLIYNLI